MAVPDEALTPGRLVGLVAATLVIATIAIAQLLGAPSADPTIVAGSDDPTASRGVSRGGDIVLTYSHPQYGGLYLAPADGGDPELLYGGVGYEYLEVDWAPGGEWFVFTAHGPHDMGLYRGDPEGSDPVLLAHGRGGTLHGPHVSPDGERIAFGRGDGASTWVIDARGGEEREITAADSVEVTRDPGCPSPEGSHVVPAGWSADGREILATVWATCPEITVAQLAFVPTDGGTVRVVADDAVPFSRPALAPERGQIAYETDRGIAVVDAAGGQARLLTVGFDPALAGDGTLAYVSPDDPSAAETYAIRVAPNADASMGRELARPGTYVDALRWSRSGSHLAFLSPTDDGTDLMVVGVSDGRVTRVAVPGDGDVVDHAYAPTPSTAG